MKIVTENNTEKEELFHLALCNIGNYLSGYGLELTCDIEDYRMAKKSLQEKIKQTGVCWEDVLLEILRMGKPLIMKDHEN